MVVNGRAHPIPRRLIVGITGASGVMLGYYIVKALKESVDCQVHLVVSKSAAVTWEYEAELSLEELIRLADQCHDEENLAASISSGSYHTDGMIIAPCSMKTLAGIVTGYADNLIVRAADVCLKENRRLVLLPREMPLGQVHLRNLYEASKLGCTLIPPMLTFYNHPKTLEDQIRHIVGKTLMQFGLDLPGFNAWDGNE